MTGQRLSCDNCGTPFVTQRNPQVLMEEVLKVYGVPGYLCLLCFVNPDGRLDLKVVRSSIKAKSAARSGNRW